MAPVLLVEPHEDSCAMLRDALQWHGVDVVCASDPVEAFQHAVRYTPALVITDLFFPYARGLALVDRLKADPRTQAIPLIVVTTAPLQPDLLRQLGGVTAVLSKPLDVGDLLVAIQQACPSIRLRQADA